MNVEDVFASNGIWKARYGTRAYKKGMQGGLGAKSKGNGTGRNKGLYVTQS